MISKMILYFKNGLLSKYEYHRKLQEQEALLERQLIDYQKYTEIG